MENIKQYLSESSKNNLNDIEKILNSDEGQDFFKSINIENFLNNRKIVATFERFYNGKSNTRLNILEDTNLSFDPDNIEDLSSIIKSTLFTLDGLKIKNSNVCNEFSKFNEQHIIKIKLDNTNLYFKLHFYYKSSNNIKESINNIIKRFNNIIYYFENEERIKFLETVLDGKPFEIYFLLYPISRTVYKRVKDILNPSTEMNKLKNLGCYNCSSGYTVFYISYNKSNQFNARMLMTRIPEMLGLFTHELGHLLGIDFEIPVQESYFTTTGMMGGKKLNKNHKNKMDKLPINGMNIQFNEAICNTNTTLIHTICNALELGDILGYDKNKDYFELFKILYKIEILYSIYHSAKILYWLGFSNFDAFFNAKSYIVYIQTAYLFEYTIIRSFMLLIYSYLINVMSYDPKDGYLKFSLQPDENWSKWNKFADQTIDLMVGVNQNNKLRKSYEKVFNKFMIYIEKKKNGKIGETDCGEVNMEYFCIDLKLDSTKCKIMKGGSKINYKKKYRKYKKKYLLLKET